MICALDVGNTNIVLGVFDDDYTLKYSWRIATDASKTEDELYVIIKSFFKDKEISFDFFKGVVISSVVPGMIFALKLLSKKYFGLEPIVVSNAINTGLVVPEPYTSKLGADRIVDIVGAKVSNYLPAIVVDFGTATTFDYVDENMIYKGGVICPGINISADALYQKAAQLPRVEIERVDSSLGMDTITQMQAGLFYGFIGQFEAIINSMKKEIGKDVKVVLTGGLAKLLSKNSKQIDIIDEELTLKGIIEIYKLNK
ncbi:MULTISPECIES: type III pantothenate kinase [unclassified Gemella]|uniref:type III pantothenate kinase n=1 Tax=unclassified Gemella TaxID=2624949 RepID=UPI001073AA2A|nr:MULTISPECIES: type III pantothenate kinase [unclassified Gemella]MBF0710764.1 type III pantothenate kinase [Gemella sp. GL1.1]MBF0746667.1 type III pantothenate kinase [Gemella sp. 19428wG2_WT2a]NYS28108.1 type III pantothenate kinase [Gemella sp. GL1]TFU60017.1 type III pantothenate kinase [Gemella sp. WT2a]